MSIAIDQLRKYLDSLNNFLSEGRKTANYKFVLFLSIIRLIEQDRGIKKNFVYLIDYDLIAKLFFKIQYVLQMKYRLKILNSRSSEAKIVELINRVAKANNNKYTIEEADIDEDLVNEIQKSVLNRTVVFLLRKNLEFYDFYDENFQIIKVPYNISDELEFRRYLSGKQIKYLGFDLSVCEFINMTYYSLLQAVIADHTQFLETLNLTPKLLAKVQDSVLESFGPRQISPADKQILFKFDDTCFYCGKKLSLDNFEVDHFLPYVFLFDSPIWNMVSACKDCNRKKLDKIPQDVFLQKLINRNLNPDFQRSFPKRFDAPIPEINQKIQMLYTICQNDFEKITL